jgi:hypothetical protein
MVNGSTDISLANAPGEVPPRKMYRTEIQVRRGGKN